MLNKWISPTKRDYKDAFTLVEVLTALFLVMVGIVSAYSLINQSLSFSKNASSEMVAAYLGKEGIEITRNIRDSNYLKMLYGISGYEDDDSWKSGLQCEDCFYEADCESGCAADYSSTRLSTDNVGEQLSYDDSTGFFGYSGTSASIYRRLITITDEDSYLKVSVLVEWAEHGRNRSLVVEENLYNWWPQ